MADVHIGRRALASHVGTFIAGGLLTTAIISHAVPASRNHAERYAALDAFAQSLSYIVKHYVEPVDERALIYGGIRGMIRKLDPYSAFLEPERYARLREDTEGEFGGVGITLAIGSRGRDGLHYPLVLTVAPGSPASRAGVMPGDWLLAIDQESTAQRGVISGPRAWHSRLRGAPGSRVRLHMKRRSWPSARNITLVRKQIKVPSVSSFLVEPGIGYIAVSRFQEATAADVQSALEDLAAGGLEVLILDLRGNPGGLLDQAVRVADLFLEQGTIVTIRGRRDTDVEREVAHARGTWSKPRILVLMDQDSASAAEIVAGALQDHGRATVMGLPSYGKGSVQTFVDLADGSGLKLTTARYYTPRGRTLEDTGITPDIHVEAFAEEVVVAGPGDPQPEGEASKGPDQDMTGSAQPPKSATMRDRLVGDHQFEVAYRTVKQWLRSKKSARR